jgi:ribose transport system substrate-binding protein
MSRWSKIIVSLWLLVNSTVLLSCSKTRDDTKTLTFLFVPGIQDPFYYTMERGARAKAQELGVRLIIADYPKTWGPEAQIPIIEAATRRNDLDLILIAPTSVDELIAPLAKLAARGIQIITVDTFLGDGDYAKDSPYSFPLSYIGTDNELGGKKIAEHLARLLGETGKVYVNTTTPDTSSTIGRVQGFEAGIAEFPNMEVAGVDYNLDVQETARRQTLAMLQKNPDIVGVFGVNVFSAQGAYQAVVEAGLTGAVKIASWDATPDLISALRAGQVDLVLAQKPAEMGALAVEWGYKFFREHAQVPKKVIPGFEFFTRDNVTDPAMQQFIYQ